MSSVLRLSMVSLIPLLTELLSSQLPRQTHTEHQNLPLRQQAAGANIRTPSPGSLRQLRLPVPTYAHHPRGSMCHEAPDKALCF